MRNIQSKVFATFLMVLFCTTSLLAQTKMTADETAIKKVIQDETHWFNQRNYDKWAECISRDEMAFFSWTTPFKSENAVNVLKGWTNISREYKKMMASMPVRPTDQPTANFKFKIAGDMAYVTFDEYGSTDNSVRVMEKVNGQWKILRMESLDVEDFLKYKQLYALQRYAGDYQWDLANTQIKVGSPKDKMSSGDVKIEEMTYGIRVNGVMHMTRPDGSYFKMSFEDFYAYDMSSGKVSAFSTNNDMESWAGFGWIDDTGDLMVEFKQPESKGKGISKFHRNADGSVVMYWTIYDETGKITWDNVIPLKIKGSQTQP